MISNTTLKGTLLLFLHENALLRKRDNFMSRAEEYLTNRGLGFMFSEFQEEIHSFLFNHLED